MILTDHTTCTHLYKGPASFHEQIQHLGKHNSANLTVMTACPSENVGLNRRFYKTSTSRRLSVEI